VVRIEQWCRICDTLALVRDEPAEEDTYVIEGCECIGPFRAQGLFWMAAPRLRVEHREEFRSLSEYIRREGTAGEMPVITLENWRALATDHM
jgi:hypothetical protein